GQDFAAPAVLESHGVQGESHAGARDERQAKDDGARAEGGGRIHPTSLTKGNPQAYNSVEAAHGGKLLLRLALGVLVLLHGVAKIVSGPAFVVGLVEKIGLPGGFGYLVYVGEVIAPLLLIMGLWTRLAALVIAINMLVAVFLVHMPEL